MNLGCLVTAAQYPAPLTVILIDNGLYEVTGGQDVAGAGGPTSVGLARAAGIGRVYSFDRRRSVAGGGFRGVGWQRARRSCG